MNDTSKNRSRGSADSASQTCFTIGYEGRTVEQVLDRLASFGVELLLDIRLGPSSRKAGFSKKGLAEACHARGFRHIHDPELGRPPDLMDHVRDWKVYDAEVSEAYRRHLLTKETALRAAIDHLRDGSVGLLCYEADATNCHRKIVAEEIAKRLKTGIQQLSCESCRGYGGPMLMAA